MKNDEIIERHLEMKVILELAKKYEDQDIVISKIPSATYCFYWFPENDLNVPLLIGRYPVFEEFQIIFEEYKQKFKLIPKEDVL